jgi:hypothetical protein
VEEAPALAHADLPEQDRPGARTAHRDRDDRQQRADDDEQQRGQHEVEGPLRDLRERAEDRSAHADQRDAPDVVDVARERIRRQLEEPGHDVDGGVRLGTRPQDAHHVRRPSVAVGHDDLAHAEARHDVLEVGHPTDDEPVRLELTGVVDEADGA